MSEINKCDIESLKTDVLEEIAELREELLESGDPYGLIYEIIDMNIPIYFWDTLQYANSDLSLATNIPSDVFGENPNAIDLININIRNVLEEEATDKLEEILAEKRRKK